jgi:hypothetical protein
MKRFLCFLGLHLCGPWGKTERRAILRKHCACGHKVREKLDRVATYLPGSREKGE